MEHEMKHRDFRSLKDSLVGSEPTDEHHAQTSTEHNEGLLRNADPEVGERIYRQRDAQAVEGGSATERMNRPGRLGTAGERGLAFGTSEGELKPGPAWLEGLRNRTPVQHNPSGKNDQQDVDRPKPVTY
jgi:hypothetical protein